MKYEHRIESLPVKQAQELLDELGPKGYEVVAAYEYSPGNMRIIFKRPDQKGTLGMIGA